MQYLSVSNHPEIIFLRICEADVQLHTNREHMDMVENLIRRVVASGFDTRLAAANKKFIEKT